MTISQLPTSTAAAGPSAVKNRFWSWLIFTAAALYFLVPLGATFYWSLRAEKGTLGFEAYRRLFADANFLPAFSEAIVNAVATIVLSLLIIVPTAYWVTLRLPRARPLVEFIIWEKSAPRAWASLRIAPPRFCSPSLGARKSAR